MKDWNEEKASDDGKPVMNTMNDLGYMDMVIFKIKHEKTRVRTVREDLRRAARQTCYKRNRSVDDGYMLVGDRCNVNNDFAED